MKCVRKWKAQAQKLNISMTGGLLRSDTGHHAHIFTARQDVPQHLQADITSKAHAQDCDIVCMVKRWMGDNSLCQPPLVVMPVRPGIMPDIVPPPDALIPRRLKKNSKREDW